MGGFVYEGSTLSSCHQGRYYYADYCTGRSFSFQLDSGAAADLQEGPTSPSNIVSWGRDGDGELYILTMDGTVQRLVNGT